MYELPEGWKWVRLGDIAKINPKKSEVKELLSKNIEVSFIPMNAVDDVKGEIIEYQTKNINEVYKGYTYFKEGDIIFAKITPCMENGKCAIAKNLKNGIGFGSTEFHVIRLNENISKKWVWYFLRFSKTREEAKKHFTGSVGQKRVPADFLKNLLIPIPFKDGKPDLEKQKQIVEKIEKIFNEIDKAIELRQKAINETKELFNSVLNKIFKEAEEGEGWKWVKLKEIIKTEKGKKPKTLKPEKYNGDLPYLTADYFRTGIIKQYSEEKEKLKIVKPGDLVLIWDGSKAGDIFISDIEGILASTMVKLIIKNNEIFPKFVYYIIKQYFPILNKNTTGSGIPHVSKEVFNNLLISIPYKDNKPDIEKQKQIANYLDNLSEKIKQLEQLQEKQLNLFKELKESILNKAFRGELI